jgi:hypothetical protein
VFAPMIPLIFLAFVLARGGLPAAVVSALVLFLNGALYAGVGWLSWPVLKLLARDKPRWACSPIVEKTCSDGGRQNGRRFLS